VELDPERAYTVATQVTEELAPVSAIVTLFPEAGQYASRVRVSLGEVMEGDLTAVIEQLRSLVALVEREGLAAEIVQSLDIVLKATGGA
jgi:hypothetical protein